jgi:hypothetical protein
MIFRWLKRRRELSARVSAEAETMIALFGDGAYYEARNRALAAERRQPAIHIGRGSAARSPGARAATTSRYLEPDGSIRAWPCGQGGEM